MSRTLEVSLGMMLGHILRQRGSNAEVEKLSLPED
jgi:hypothetical protein